MTIVWVIKGGKPRNQRAVKTLHAASVFQNFVDMEKRTPQKLIVFGGDQNFVLVSTTVKLRVAISVRIGFRVKSRIGFRVSQFSV